MFLKIAWLNIWRNKRRTLITASSVFFAVLLAILARSMTEGVYENMIHNVVGYSSGYLQIHQKGYWGEKSIDNSFEANELLNKNLLSNPNVTHIMPRLETFALASFGDKTKGVMILGIDPEAEKEANKLNEKIIKGQYLETANDKDILIGEGLASQFKLTNNDTMVLLGQGYHATTAAGKFRVKGIIKLGSPDLNNNMIYMPLQQAQFLQGAENRLTAISMMINKSMSVEKLKYMVEKQIDIEKYELMNWKEMMPEMDQFIEADSIGHFIIIGVLYLIISFGLFGTLLMMVFERTREFGILIAIGMKKQLLAFILLLESLIIALIGCLAGVFAGVLTINWFKNHPIYFTGELKELYEYYGIEPIIFFSVSEKIFIIQTLIVLTLAVLLALYPGYKLMKLKPIEAINS